MKSFLNLLEFFFAIFQLFNKISEKRALFNFCYVLLLLLFARRASRFIFLTYSKVHAYIHESYYTVLNECLYNIVIRIVKTVKMCLETE